MFKKSIILLIVSLFSFHSDAQNVSISEAFVIAQSFMAKKGVALARYEKSNTRSDKSYSIFKGKSGKGFIIVKEGMVIGYSTECSIDINNLPPIIETVATITRGDSPKRKTTPISPMITCDWQQDSPFNDLLPYYEREDSKGHCAAGCGAVALAQILYYYKPKGCKAIPSHSFGREDLYDLEALEETTFDWDNIIYKYYKPETSYTEKQAEAVAWLMLYVGHAIENQYSRTRYATGSWLPVKGLYYFGFSDESYETKKGISTEELWNLLDRELPLGRPVIMSGYTNSNSGHTFVIDGRDDEGLYHVNDGKGRIAFLYLSPDDVKNGSQTIYSYMLNGWCTVPIMPEGYEIPSNIINVVNPTRNSDVYNLQGQKVSDSIEGLPKGIYIKNGKKRVVN